MAEHELPIAAFLAGELDASMARVVDDHLLSCDQCWLAVREDRAGRALAATLREPADPALADRIRLAVELAGPSLPRALRRVRLAGGRLAGSAVTVAVAVVLTVLALLTGWPRHGSAHDSAAVARVVALARHLPPAPGAPSLHAVPIDTPRTLTVGGQVLTVRAYAFDGGSVLVARSTRSFAMPADAHIPSSRTMRWTVTRGTVTVFCPHATVLVAGTEPAGELSALAKVLHLT